jgi:hypothetical protein
MYAVAEQCVYSGAIRAQLLSRRDEVANESKHGPGYFWVHVPGTRTLLMHFIPCATSLMPQSIKNAPLLKAPPAHNCRRGFTTFGTILPNG